MIIFYLFWLAIVLGNIACTLVVTLGNLKKLHSNVCDCSQVHPIVLRVSFLIQKFTPSRSILIRSIAD